MKLRRIIAVCLGSSILLSGCSGTEKTIPELNESVTEQADISAVLQGDLYNITYYDGWVQPETTSITATHNGVITKVNARPGLAVTKGEVLAVVSATEGTSYDRDELAEEYEYEHSQLELSLEIAQTQLELIESSSETKIQEQQLEIDSIQLELDKLEDEYETGLFSISEDIIATEVEESTQEYEITAPCDGTISYSASDLLGSEVSSSVILFQIAEDSLTIETEKISESLLNEANQIYARYKTQEIAVEAIEDSGNSSKSCFQISEEIPEMAAGDYISIYIVTDYREDVNYIPVDALKADAAGYYVYLWKDGERTRQPVEIDLITNAYIEVTKGVAKGDMILVSE